VKDPLREDSIDNKEMKHFFDVLVFAVNQPNEAELSEIIKDEIGTAFNTIDFLEFSRRYTVFLESEEFL